MMVYVYMCVPLLTAHLPSSVNMSTNQLPAHPTNTTSGNIEMEGGSSVGIVVGVLLSCIVVTVIVILIIIGIILIVKR